MTPLERVSVVIACYNQGGFLGEAIASVLRQSYSPVEIIVIDDGSSDDTGRVATAVPAVQYVRQRNQGVAAARNAGLALSTGGSVLFLDADDRLLPNALRDGVASLQARPECAFVYGHVQLIDERGVAIATPAQACRAGDLYLQILEHNFIWTCGAVLYRRTVFDTVGRFDSRVSGSADFDLHARILRTFPACCHDRVVLEYRRHPGSMSHNPASMLKAAVTARRRHRPLLRGWPAHLAALQTGIRATQAYYGDRLACRIAGDVSGRRWRALVPGCLALLRYDPIRVARRARRLLRQVWPWS